MVFVVIPFFLFKNRADPMQIKIQPLLRLLESLSPGLTSPHKETTESSHCFHFTSQEIVTFNGEVVCRVANPLRGVFEGSVRANPLLEVLRKLQGEEVSVTTEQENLILRAEKQGETTLLSGKLSSAVPTFPTFQEWKSLPKEFDLAIEKVQSCVNPDATVFETTCIHFHPHWVEGFDNYQICRYGMDLPLEKSVLIRNSSLKSFPTLSFTEFSEANHWIHFRNEAGIILSCCRYQQAYPDLSKAVQREGTLIQFPRSLDQAAEVAKIFSSEQQESNRVKVELIPGKLTLTGEGISGRHIVPKRVKYDGPPLKFFIHPSILQSILKEPSECTITSQKLQMHYDSYTYVVYLVK